MLVERDEFGAGGQLRVEHQQPGRLSGGLLPELAEAHDFVCLVGLGDVGVGVAQRRVFVVWGENNRTERVRWLRLGT